MRPEDILPVLLFAEQVDSNHRTQSKEERDVDIASHVSSAGEYREESQQVGCEDEEEHCEQVGSERLEVFLADCSLDNIVVDSHDEHFHQTDKSSRSLALLVFVLIPTSAREEDSDEHEHNNPYLCYGLCYAQVERSYACAVGHLLVDLAMMRCIEEVVGRQILRSTQRPVACSRTAYDYGQWYAEVLSLVRSDMPLV